MSIVDDRVGVLINLNQKYFDKQAQDFYVKVETDLARNASKNKNSNQFEFQESDLEETIREKALV